MADEQLKIDVVLRNFASKELKKVDGDIARFGKGALGIFRGISGAVFSLKGALAGLGVALTAKGLFDLVKGTADQADNIRDLSIELGASTEALSELEYVAKQSGNTLDSLAGGFRILQKAVGEFRLLGTGPLVEFLDRLSPTFREMVESGAPVEELFQQFSREIRNLGDAERVFVTSKLFGRGGSPLLRTLAEDLDKGRLKAREFGLTISGEAADAADAFNDALDDLSKSLEGLKRQVILPLLPEFTKTLDAATQAVQRNKPEIINFFADTVEAGGQFARSFAETTASLEATFGQLTAIGKRFTIVQQEMSLLKQIISGIPNELPDADSGDPGNVRGIDKAYRDLVHTVDELFDGSDRRQRSIRSAGEAVEASARSGAKQLRELAKVQAAAQQGFEEFGPTLEELYLDAGPTLEQLRGDVEAVRVETEALTQAERDRGDRAVAETERRMQAYREEREFLLGLRAGFEDLRIASTEWGLAARDAVHGVADALSHNTTDALLEVIEGTKSAKDAFRDMARSVLRDIARMIIQTLVLKAVQSGLGGLIGGGGGSGAGTLTRADGSTVELAKGGVVPGRLEPVRGHLAAGGVVRQEGLFRLREAGRNEAVIPLPDNRSVPVKFVGGAGGGGSVTQNIHVTYQSSALTTAEESRMIQRNMRQIAGGIAAELKQNPSFRETVRAA